MAEEHRQQSFRSHYKQQVRQVMEDQLDEQARVHPRQQAC